MDHILSKSDLPIENSILYNIDNVETFNSCYNCVYCDECTECEDCGDSNINPEIINYINTQLASYLKTSDAENLYAKIDTIDDLISDLNNQFAIINANFANIQSFLEI